MLGTWIFLGVGREEGGNATLLHLLGFNRKKLTCRVLRLEMHLSGVVGSLVPGIMA